MSFIGRFSTCDADFDARFTRLIAIETAQDVAVENAVTEILAQVRARGDAALLEYTRKFDQLEAPSVPALQLDVAAIEHARAAISVAQLDSLEQAARRIRAFHERQVLQSWSYQESDGTVLGQRVTALDRIGMYVPGGKAAYPSTVLMNAVPAKIAGVGEIIMTVPTPRGERNNLVLAAAGIAGVDRVYTLGGAQAIAALAYGTQTIPAVDKIVGPGNAYVAAAKRRVFGVVGIDMVAGPSEILVICDGQTEPDWVAMDLFAQAEHDEMAQAILLCPDARYIERVLASIEKLLESMPRQAVIRASLGARGALIEVRDLEEACELANRIAPEHLELSVADPEKWAPKITHAGAIFLGRYASESLGDYCAGPNHVLPTSRSARFSSPLGVYDFQKRTSMICISAQGAQSLGAISAELATGEGLHAHAAAARLRMKRP